MLPIRIESPDQYAEMKSLFTDDCVMKLVNDLKLLGQCAMQVVYNELHTEILMVEHFPVETLRAERANEDGDILGYYYYHNWPEYRKGDELERFPAFGTSKEGIEILFVKPYKTGILLLLSSRLPRWDYSTQSSKKKYPTTT